MNSLEAEFWLSGILVLANASFPWRPSRCDQGSKPLATDSPIRFEFQPIDFKLDSNESKQYHGPETMAGGVPVFDYNNDGELDIFFTNGAPPAPTSTPR